MDANRRATDRGAHVVMAGGGTGGHLFPGIAIADEIVSRAPQTRITFLTTNRPLDRQLLSKTGYGQHEQIVRPFSTRPWHWPGFIHAWRQSVRAARELLRDDPPLAVIGLGGYPAGPAVVAARRLGIPTAILNPDAIPGRANRFLSNYADLVVLQWARSGVHFPASVRCEAWGCPLRRAFRSTDRELACREFGLDASRPVLLVTGASQGARTINQAMMRVWPQFRDGHSDWQLLHLSGPDDEPGVRAAYAAAGAPAAVRAFVAEMWLALSAADVVVSRAGASTLAELSAVGRPAILLPYPYHRDRHQHANAAVLAEVGAAHPVEDVRDPERNAAAILSGLEHFADPEVLASAGAAARSVGHPDAAGRVAEWAIAPSGPREPARQREK